MKLDVPPSLTKSDRTRQSTDPADQDDSGGGSWRRRAMMIGVTVAAVALVRRLRSGGSDERGTDATAEAYEPTDASTDVGERSSTDSTSVEGADGGGGIARKIGMLVALVAVTATARALRRRLMGR